MRHQRTCAGVHHANVAVESTYAITAIVTSQMYYRLCMDYWFQLQLLLVMQLTGIGLAELGRGLLIWPTSMVWPQNLVVGALLNTLHGKDDEEASGWCGGWRGR